MNDRESTTTAQRFESRPLTPRPRLFAVLLLVLAGWVAFMIWMYVATVYPTRHNGAPSTTSRLTPPAEAR